MLLGTTIGRGVIWGALLPIVWVFLRTDWFLGSLSAAYAAMVVLGLLDGTMVAFSNVVDIRAKR